jgi:phosphatidylserine/phosphatidylglycerophosphate/cardiolipin synthase-like enzyme
MASELPIPHREITYGNPRKVNPLRRRFGRIQEDIYPTESTKLSILPSGRAVLDATKNLITTARHHTYTQTYTIDADLAGVEIFQTFKEASRAKPDVKFGLLVDHIIAMVNSHGVVGKNNTPATEKKEATFRALNDLNDNGHAQVVVTNDFNFWKLENNPPHRDHKKATTADGQRAIVGSANIGEHHLEWVDGGIYLEGPAAAVVEDDVASTFAHASGLKNVLQTRTPQEFFKRHRGLPTGKDILGSIVRNPQTRGRRVIIHEPNGEKIHVLTDSFWGKMLFFPGYQEATSEGFSMVENAPKGAKVDIFTPYPGIYSLTNYMAKARKKGVEVTLHIPSNNNIPLYNPNVLRQTKGDFLRKPVEWQLKAWKARMKRLGIQLVEFDGDDVSRGMIHLKAIRVQNPDGTGSLLIGSPNFGRGLIAHHNREIAVKVENAKTLGEFDEFMATINSQSTKVL